MSGFSKALPARDFAPSSPLPRKVGSALKRWWLAYMDWRLQQLTIERLRCMSDRELKDIGLTRSHIELAVRGVAAQPSTTSWPWY